MPLNPTCHKVVDQVGDQESTFNAENPAQRTGLAYIPLYRSPAEIRIVALILVGRIVQHLLRKEEQMAIKEQRKIKKAELKKKEKAELKQKLKAKRGM